MRITSWNIQHGIAYQAAPAQDFSLADNLAALHRDIESDIYLFQEVDCRLPRTDYRNQPAELAAAVGAIDFRFAPTVIGEPGLKSVMPEQEERVLISETCSTFNGYGNLFISRIPVREWLRFDLGKSPIGAPLLIGMGAGQRLIVAPDELRTATAAVLENKIIVINTHLSFVPGYNIKQLRQLIQWAKALEAEYASEVIIAGDFNLPDFALTPFRQWRTINTGPTFPQWNPKITFDHFMVRACLTNTWRARSEAAQMYGDHLPITVERIDRP